jgi:hypothetical protein
MTNARPGTQLTASSAQFWVGGAGDFVGAARRVNRLLSELVAARARGHRAAKFLGQRSARHPPDFDAPRPDALASAQARTTMARDRGGARALPQLGGTRRGFDQTGRDGLARRERLR